MMNLPFGPGVPTVPDRPVSPERPYIENKNMQIQINIDKKNYTRGPGVPRTPS